VAHLGDPPTKHYKRKCKRRRTEEGGVVGDGEAAGTVLLTKKQVRSWQDLCALAAMCLWRALFLNTVRVLPVLPCSGDGPSCGKLGRRLITCTAECDS
jgi:hypothetical protein